MKRALPDVFPEDETLEEVLEEEALEEEEVLEVDDEYLDDENVDMRENAYAYDSEEGDHRRPESGGAPIDVSALIQMSKAMLLFAETDQLVFCWVNGDSRSHESGGDGMWYSKTVSPEATAQAFSNMHTDSGWIQPSIKRHGVNHKGNWAVMFVPPGVHTLFITLENNAVKSLRVPLPGFVFVGVNKDYYVRAVKTDEFDPSDATYRAPLSNLDQNGKVCYGANFTEICTARTIERMWNVFCRSPFTDHAHMNRVQGVKDVFEFLRSLNKKKSFPTDVLLVDKANETVQSWVRDLIGGAL